LPPFALKGFAQLIENVSISAADAKIFTLEEAHSVPKAPVFCHHVELHTKIKNCWKRS
jgi:hypothetical protein